jgi:WD40 repeat protein
MDADDAEDNSAGSPPQLHLDFDFNALDDGMRINWPSAAAVGTGAAAAAAAAGVQEGRVWVNDRIATGAGVREDRVGAVDGYVPDDDEDAEQDEEALSAARGYERYFSGHRDMLSGRNAAWMGSRGEYVVSGSDDGCLYVWAAGSGQLVTVLKGSDKAVRRVQVGA